MSVILPLLLLQVSFIVMTFRDGRSSKNWVGLSGHDDNKLSIPVSILFLMFAKKFSGGHSALWSYKKSIYWLTVVFENM